MEKHFDGTGFLLITSVDLFITLVCFVSFKSLVSSEMRLQIFLLFFSATFYVAFSAKRMKFKCGQKHATNGFIFGGTPTSPHEWPWLVAMIYTPYDQYFCSGSIVSRKHVVSGDSTLNTIRIFIIGF